MRKLKAYMFISAHVYNIDGTDGISLLTPIPFSPQSNKQNDEHANYTRYNYCIQRDNNIVNRGTISSWGRGRYWFYSWYICRYNTEWLLIEVLSVVEVEVVIDSIAGISVGIKQSNCQ